MTASAYADATIVFATMHGKAALAAPAFSLQHRAKVVAPPTIDTDQFGTFTGDIERTRVPIDTAMAKIRLGLELTGVQYGLASEATYSSTLGVIAHHHELLVFYDSEREMVVRESEHTTFSAVSGATISHPDQAKNVAARLGFPAISLVVISATPSGIHARKGIATEDALEAAVAELLQISTTVRIEPDYRAHLNPQRQVVIRSLAERMAARLTVRCTECQAPGWGQTGVESGLPCRACGSPTPSIKAKIFGCSACQHCVIHATEPASEDPALCFQCNP